MSKGSAAPKPKPEAAPKALQEPRWELREIALQRLNEARAEVKLAEYDIRNVTPDVEEHCDGCDRPLHPHPDYTKHRGGRQYCPVCAQLPLPTNAEMLAIVEHAFDLIGSVARRDASGITSEEFEEKVARYVDHFYDAAEEQLSYDQWKALAGVWQYLAYRPRAAA